MKLPDPRPCTHCGEVFQPPFRAHTTKYCPSPVCQEANNQTQKERCRKYREGERAKGEMKSLDREQKRAKKEPNGWKCQFCNKSLSGLRRTRCPKCEAKLFARDLRTDGNYLFIDGDDWEAIGRLRGRDVLR